MEDEVFVEIADFPEYSVSNYGRVIHTKFDREMTQSVIQNGDVTVGLMDSDGVQRRRSTKVLVADAFVPGKSERANTVLQKDNDRSNLFAGNLCWRERWMAIGYRKQLDAGYEYYRLGPVYGSDGTEYESVLSAAMATGQLPSDIILSIMNKEKSMVLRVIYRFKK